MESTTLADMQRKLLVDNDNPKKPKNKELKKDKAIAKKDDILTPRQMEQHLSKLYEKPIILREQDAHSIHCLYCNKEHDFEGVGRFTPSCEGNPIEIGSRTFTPGYGMIVYEYKHLDGEDNKYEIKNHF